MCRSTQQRTVWLIKLWQAVFPIVRLTGQHGNSISFVTTSCFSLPERGKRLSNPAQPSCCKLQPEFMTLATTSPNQNPSAN